MNFYIIFLFFTIPTMESTQYKPTPSSYFGYAYFNTLYGKKIINVKFNLNMLNPNEDDSFIGSYNLLSCFPEPNDKSLINPFNTTDDEKSIEYYLKNGGIKIDVFNIIEIIPIDNDKENEYLDEETETKTETETETETENNNYIIVFDSLDTLNKLDKEQQKSILNYSYYEKYLKHKIEFPIEKQKNRSFAELTGSALLCVSNYFAPYHEKDD